MYVCLCYAVSDRTIRDAVASGARDVGEIGRRTRAGTECGGCREKLDELIAQVREDEER